MDFDFDPLGGVSVFLGIVLVVSIVAGSLSMIAVSALLLAVLGGFAFSVRATKRNPERGEDLDHRD